MSDDHGPQRQPASVPQIEAQMKQAKREQDGIRCNSCGRSSGDLRMVSEGAVDGTPDWLCRWCREDEQQWAIAHAAMCDEIRRLGTECEQYVDLFHRECDMTAGLRAENELLRERLECVSEEINRQIRLCLDVLAKPKWTKRAEHTINTLARVLAKLEPRPPEHDGTDE